jgi:hypothetical protein
MRGGVAADSVIFGTYSMGGCLKARFFTGAKKQLTFGLFGSSLLRTLLSKFCDRRFTNTCRVACIQLVRERQVYLPHLVLYRERMHCVTAVSKRRVPSMS